MHGLLYRYPNVHEIFPTTERNNNGGTSTAWWVMGACAVGVLSLFMFYCRVGLLTLSLLSRLEKVILLVVSDVCRRSETTCLVGQYVLFIIGLAFVLLVSISLIITVRNRQKPVVLVM